MHGFSKPKFSRGFLNNSVGKHLVNYGLNLFLLRVAILFVSFAIRDESKITICNSFNQSISAKPPFCLKSI